MTRERLIPTLQATGTMVAAGESTPSVDIEMVKKASRRSTVMPVSAQLPHAFCERREALLAAAGAPRSREVAP